eukprot:gene3906-6386_t
MITDFNTTTCPTSTQGAPMGVKLETTIATSNPPRALRDPFATLPLRLFPN